MADASLRLQIITALDNAGLKATKDQVSQLERQLKRPLDGGRLDGVNKELTKIPGTLGKVAEKMGGVGRAVMGVYGAWKALETGLKVGNGLFRMFGDGGGYSLASIKNGFAELGTTAKNFFQKIVTGTNDIEAMAEANKVAMANMQVQVDAAKRANDAQMEAIKEQREAHAKNIDSIKRETQAYLNQAQTVAGLKSAGSNANVILMERRKFEEMQAYMDAGDSDAAEQIGKAYDVLIAKEKALGLQEQNAIAVQKAMRSLEGQSREYSASMARTDEAAAKLAEIESRIATLKSQSNGANKARVPAAMQLALKSARAEYEKAAMEEGRYNESVLNGYNDLRAMQINGASAYETANRGVDSALIDYYRTAEANGNAANIRFGGTIANHYGDSMDGFKLLEDISRNTEGVRDLADMLKQLMEVKR